MGCLAIRLRLNERRDHALMTHPRDTGYVPHWCRPYIPSYSRLSQAPCPGSFREEQGPEVCVLLVACQAIRLRLNERCDHALVTRPRDAHSLPSTPGARINSKAGSRVLDAPSHLSPHRSKLLG